VPSATRVPSATHRAPGGVVPAYWRVLCGRSTSAPPLT
jgi:hypothetical protein